MLSRILYVSLCVLLPLIWGVLVARLFEWLDRRLRRSGRDRAGNPCDPDIEYYI